MKIDWTIGVELELLAPAGRSRRDLAERIAARLGGTVVPFFLHQEEPSEVPGMGLFNNLTLGFEVSLPDSGWAARCVDDLTLQDDLDRKAPPKPGWFRVVSDDRRLLELVSRHGRADQGIAGAVTPLAALFGTTPQPGPDGMLRVTDRLGAPIAIGARLPGERERPCELITPPMAADHAEHLGALLSDASALGFTVAKEAATHVHFDNRALQSASTVANLVHLLTAWSGWLRVLVQTNPRCRRLGGWTPKLLELTGDARFRQLPWSLARQRLQALKLSKYRDVNLKNLVHDIPGKPTVEFRIMPGTMDPAEVLAGAALFSALLAVARRPQPIAQEEPRSWDAAAVGRALAALPMDVHAQAWWDARVSECLPQSK